MSILNIQVPRAFLPLLRPARYKGAYGGRGGAKSHFFAEQLIKRAYLKPIRWACIREVQNSLRESVRQLLIDKIAKFELQDSFEVLEGEIRGRRGSLIIFKGMQHYNAETIKSLEGFDGAWVEEAQALSLTSLRMLRPTIRKEGSEIWFSWNPRHKDDAVNHFMRVEHPPDSVCVPVGWRDNPWFPEILVKEKDHDYQADPLSADHVWGGAYQTVTQGSYYGALMAKARIEKRITKVPYDPRLPVHTAWDLGMDGCVWFIQHAGLERRVIDFYQAPGKGLDHFAANIKGRDWPYDNHYLPHDVATGETTTGKGTPRLDALRKFNIGRITVLPATSVDDGIEVVRGVLPQCWFDEERCEEGIDALSQYEAEWLEEHGVFKKKPRHNWASHPSDAFRMYAVGYRSPKPQRDLNSMPAPKGIV